MPISVRRVTPEQVDWSSCVRRLEKHMNQGQIATRVGVATSTINRMKNDPFYQPRWNTGSAVLLCLGEFEEDVSANAR